MSKTKIIKLSKIKITLEFSRCMPNPSKMREKYSYYITHSNQFKEPIILNNKNELVDGYTTYLLCKMLGRKKVEVIYNTDTEPTKKKMNKILAGTIATLLIIILIMCLLSLIFVPDEIVVLICIGIMSAVFGWYLDTIWKKVYNKLSGEVKYNDK